MSTAPEPGGIPSLGPIPGFTGPNTLFPPILATVLLCGILTTFFTAARLTTKRLISKYDVEDCESQTNQNTLQSLTDARSGLDFLIAAWVNLHFTGAFCFYNYRRRGTRVADSK